jgi:glycolate oxidase
MTQARSREGTLIAQLASVLPDDAVVDDPERLASYRSDHAVGAAAGEPAVVVFPRTTGQVSGVLRAAHARRIPVVPRGAGSGLSGGANAIDGCIVQELDTVARSMHEAIKSALDPLGILNPGRALPPR